MLANTISLVLSSGTYVLVRISEQNGQSEYRFSDATHRYQLFLRQKTQIEAGRAYDRHEMDLLETVWATPTVAEYKRQVYMVFRNLPSDPTIVLPDGLADLANASTNAILTSLVAGEV